MWYSGVAAIQRTSPPALHNSHRCHDIRSVTHRTRPSTSLQCLQLIRTYVRGAALICKVMFLQQGCTKFKSKLFLKFCLILNLGCKQDGGSYFWIWSRLHRGLMVSGVLTGSLSMWSLHILPSWYSSFVPQSFSPKPSMIRPTDEDEWCTYGHVNCCRKSEY